MATIRRRGKYQWEVQIRRRGYPTETKTFDYREDAAKWARDREREIDQGLYLPRASSEKTTIADLCSAWSESVLPTKRSADSHFRNVLKSVETAFGPRAVATLTSADVAMWRDKRVKEVSASTVRKEMFFLASLIDFGISDRGLVLAANPARLAARPSEPRHRDRRLVGNEETRLLTAAEQSIANDQLVPLIVVGLETGARLGELLALQWNEVDLKKRVASIRGREVDGKRQLKNSELVRYAPLSPRVIDVLQAMPRPLKGGRIFSRWTRADSFTKIWTRTCHVAGIEGLHFHDLRHEFASRIAPRVSMHVLMKLLGHKSPAMVSRYYNQTSDDVSRLAVELYG